MFGRFIGLRRLSQSTRDADIPGMGHAGRRLEALDETDSTPTVGVPRLTAKAGVSVEGPPFVFSFEQEQLAGA